MKIFETSKVQLLKKSLDVYTRQHEAIAENIAHANDDNFTRVKTDFGNVLKKDLDQSLKVTDPRHIADSPTPETHGRPHLHEKIDVSREMGELAANQIRFDFAARLLNRTYRDLNMSITGRQ